ncbi:Ni,Fe-hydrogenase I large subunit [Candidatus Thiodictyon syntrophicum]|jgi:hypothetical protein|uniref:Ni,Fe-hydrogenase I large subunit n=1 Tax=Candidatus Thiodictyon syntrophicum TaxID=1166950 RepID=UPI000C2D55D6|nr:Ni,Fe-hydrogenase I large subunit [Candidatus Thiodictyon syntrophicum]
MTDPAGKLHIRLDPHGVRIDSTRPVGAASLLVGRDIAHATRLLPVLFSICAVAQAAAGAAAIEGALGLAVAPRIASRRRRLVAAETLREHLWRILLDWPGIMGEPADAAAMARVMAGYGDWRAALTAGVDLFAPGAALPAAEPAAAPAAECARRALADLGTLRVFGRPPDVWLEQVAGLEALAAWAGQTDTAAARLVHRTLTAGQAGFGRAGVGALPPLSATDLDRCLDGADPAVDAFVARPTWDGQPRESSPLTRQLEAPLVQDLRRSFGNGLLPRLAAQLVEAARIMAGAEASAAEPAPGDLPAGLGLAQVPAARGLLVHRVRLCDGRVTGYRILAPTEWNFHPAGVVAVGLAGLMAHADPVDLGPLARLFITAVDPCVDFELQLPGRPQ